MIKGAKLGIKGAKFVLAGNQGGEINSPHESAAKAQKNNLIERNMGDLLSAKKHDKRHHFRLNPEMDSFDAKK